MSGADSVMWALERNWDMVDAALEGLDDETMSRQPADHGNFIAWILWHMNHVVDTYINTRLQSKTDLWIRDGWHARFELDARARIMGYSSEGNCSELGGSEQLTARGEGVKAPGAPGTGEGSERHLGVRPLVRAGAAADLPGGHQVP